MRYDWHGHVPYPELSPEYFTEIDRRFFSDIGACMPWQALPFDPLIPYSDLDALKVLEVGVGSGSVAGLLSQSAKFFVGIDLTSHAVQATGERLRQLGRPAQVLQMDAERLAFSDESFDYVWSWGVIHHSANTGQALAEIARVLSPGGRVTTMVYHRSWWHSLIVTGFVRGIIQGGFARTRSLHVLMQENIDGALARFYNAREWIDLVSEWYVVEECRVYGSKTQLVPLRRGKTKSKILSKFPDGLARTLTNDLRLGTFLVTTLRKK
jgi:SAM-dependent methyltransferase